MFIASSSSSKRTSSQAVCLACLPRLGSIGALRFPNAPSLAGGGMGRGGASASFSARWISLFSTFRVTRHSFPSLLLASTTRVSVWAMKRSASYSEGKSTEAGWPLGTLTTPLVNRGKSPPIIAACALSSLSSAPSLKT